MGEPNEDENFGLEVEVQGRKSPKALIGEAWNQMNDAARSYLIGYGEGYIAGRQAPAGA